MKENYRAWSLKIDDFYNQPTEIEQLAFMLNFAVLAPSSHNSQPWKFQVREKAIDILFDKSRRLAASDKNDREAYVSLGSAIANIVVASDYYGFSATVEYLNEENLAARIVFTKKTTDSKTPNHLVFSIPKRVTNRNKYLEKLPPQSFFDEMNSYTKPDCTLFLVTEGAIKNQLADAALAASIAAMEDSNFRKELSQYVKVNTTSSPIGMPAFGMGIPMLISFIAPTAIKFFNMNKLSRKSDEALLKKHTPVFAVIATRSDDKQSWLKTGELYEAIALTAVRSDLATAMWAAPIQIGEYFHEFQKILETDFRPQAFFRVGYPEKETPHSPRISATTLLS